MNLSKMTYGEARGDFIAFEKTHRNKKDQLYDEEKKTIIFKVANEEQDGVLDDDELAFITRIVVDNYKKLEIKEQKN